ncbi:acyltransferase domain-containing protein [Kibdelosporangium persicum]|uniref:Phthiocerol synthesis polyketide synthase type I PpsE n=1 Tax=Kibdelosporangium persicum TaxID=2698649 RepID=A0ABX2F8U3_9PSEU|nr:acyltransferase domain-containing protein [Kibdelosporangium persicum]NRN67215.1 Phthiocerol synthesis polyketide synthase type I PpsE [Kibdelosporangium persicum]
MTSPIALLLPGQGAQYPGMAVELYGAEPVFTAAMDEFFSLMGAVGAGLRADWLSDHPVVPLDDASRAQPLLFAIGYALGRALIARGIVPSVLIGHSVGELAAAALAGVYDPPGAARIILARYEAMATAPAGGLLAVSAAAGDVERHLDARSHEGGVGIAAINAPGITVLAGPEAELVRIREVLAGNGISAMRVGSRQPFHCPAVAAAGEKFEAGFAGVTLRPPRIPIVSTRTARVVTPEEAVTPGFWARQLDAPVLFWPALDTLLSAGAYTVVEAGPGKGLSMLARKHPAVRAKRSTVVSLSPSRASGTLTAWHAGLDHLTT